MSGKRWHDLCLIFLQMQFTLKLALCFPFSIITFCQIFTFPLYQVFPIQLTPPSQPPLGHSAAQLSVNALVIASGQLTGLYCTNAPPSTRHIHIISKTIYPTSLTESKGKRACKIRKQQTDATHKSKPVRPAPQHPAHYSPPAAVPPSEYRNAHYTHNHPVRYPYYSSTNSGRRCCCNTHL